MPQAFSRPRAIKLSDINKALGDALSPKDVRASLAAYGYTVTGSGSLLLVRLPSYLTDLMHTVDVIEDVAISRGYHSFGPIMTSTFTVGGLSRIEQLSDKVRELMVGFGFQEIVSNILGSRGDLIHRMRLPDGHPEARCVEIETVMSQSYECLRQWVLPSLLRVETASSRSFYPHFLFELGEVVVLDPQTETGTRTEVRLGALLAHANANFSETHSFLDLLCFYLGWAYALTPTDHPSFLEGRVGRVEREGNAVGLIGERRPGFSGPDTRRLCVGRLIQRARQVQIDRSGQTGGCIHGAQIVKDPLGDLAPFDGFFAGLAQVFDALGLGRRERTIRIRTRYRAFFNEQERCPHGIFAIRAHAATHQRWCLPRTPRAGRSYRLLRWNRRRGCSRLQRESRTSVGKNGDHDPDRESDSHCLTPTLGLCQLRSEEHTSELQSRPHLACRLLPEI